MREDLIKSHMASMLVCLPTFCLSVWIMETYISWPAPTLVTAGILFLAVADFALIVALECYRSRIGRLTLPALLAVVGVVMLFMIAQGINRYYTDFGYKWLLPAVVAGMAVSGIAIFRERTLALKCLLAVNTVVLSVLWGLGATEKIAMPF